MEPADLQSAPPALLIHCQSIYKKMFEKAKKLPVGEGPEYMIVYEGFLTQLIAQQSLSNPYYTFATRALKQMGCIRQIKRGGGRSPSIWELITEPTEELYFGVNPLTDKDYQSEKKGTIAAMQQQILNLGKRVTDLEKVVEHIAAEPAIHIIGDTE